MSEQQNNNDKPASKSGAEDKGGMPSRRKVYIALVVAASAIILVWNHYLQPMIMGTERGAPAVTSGMKSVGQPKIGGPFQLVNQDGKTVTQADFAGKYMLMYFGYTFCPDVCPTSLTEMSGALDLLGAKAAKVTPIFVTVDPERDTPDQLKMYVEHFHPNLVGLTGTQDQVAAAAKVFKAYYAKVGDGYDDNDYLMDHSSITYLMGPDGKFVTHFGHGVAADVMAKRLHEIL